jgi:hypothetical protein
MPKKLRVRFSGLCFFVPSKDEARCKMCVVMPDAIDHFARISPTPEKGSRIDGKDGEVQLNGNRVVFGFEGGTATPALDFADGLKGVVEIKDILGDDFDACDKRMLDGEPDKVVRSQILLEKGLSKVDNDFGSEGWVLPRVDGRRQSRNVFGEIFFEIEGFEAAKLLVTKFGQGLEDAEIYNLVSNDEDVIDILIGNDCPGGVGVGRPRIDRDFAWHYKLLEKREEIERMRAMPLPERLEVESLLTTDDKIKIQGFEQSKVGQEKFTGFLEEVSRRGDAAHKLLGTNQIDRAIRGMISKRELNKYEARVYSIRTGCNCLRASGAAQDLATLDQFLPA